MNELLITLAASCLAAMLATSCAAPSIRSPLDGTWKLSSVECVDGSKTELLTNYQKYIADTKHDQLLEIDGTRVVMRSRDWNPNSKKFCESAFEEKWELAPGTYRALERRALPVADPCPPSADYDSGRTHRYVQSGTELKIFDASTVTTAADVAKSSATKAKPFCETGSLVWKFVR